MHSGVDCRSTAVSAVVEMENADRHCLVWRQAVLAIPATSAPYERIFSTTAVVLNARRSSLSAHVVDKIVYSWEQPRVRVRVMQVEVRQGDSAVFHAHWFETTVHKTALLSICDIITY